MQKNTCKLNVSYIQGPSDIRGIVTNIIKPLPHGTNLSVPHCRPSVDPWPFHSWTKALHTNQQDEDTLECKGVWVWEGDCVTPAAFLMMNESYYWGPDSAPNPAALIKAQGKLHWNEVCACVCVCVCAPDQQSEWWNGSSNGHLSLWHIPRDVIISRY